MLKIIFFAVILIALAFAGFAIKILVTKKGEFKKTCSTVDPKTGERLGCVCGEGNGGGSCENKGEVNVHAVEIKTATLENS